jgi:hypothetical protein
LKLATIHHTPNPQSKSINLQTQITNPKQQSPCPIQNHRGLTQNLPHTAKITDATSSNGPVLDQLSPPPNLPNLP